MEPARCLALIHQRGRMPSRIRNALIAAAATMSIGCSAFDPLICTTDPLRDPPMRFSLSHWLTAVPCAAALMLGAAGAALAQESDSAAVAAVIERYHHALATGDSSLALALLADDVVVLESGGIETHDEYRSHHLPADIQFARAVSSTREAPRVVTRDDVAWASSTSRARGEFRGRAIDSMGAELMVLVRTKDGWRIAAIHWSSRSR